MVPYQLQTPSTRSRASSEFPKKVKQKRASRPVLLANRRRITVPGIDTEHVWYQVRILSYLKYNET